MAPERTAGEELGGLYNAAVGRHNGRDTGIGGPDQVSAVLDCPEGRHRQVLGWSGTAAEPQASLVMLTRKSAPPRKNSRTSFGKIAS